MSHGYLFEFVTGSMALAWLSLSLIGLALERLRPIEHSQPGRAILLNLGYSVVHAWAVYGLAPIAATVSVLAVNTLGGGLVELPGGGWGLLWAIPAYLLALDFSEYLFHRVQHAWPPLWAMHSLHHSETSLNVTTTLRHFWLEAAIKTVSIYAVIGVVFKPSATVAAVYVGATYWNFVAHMNARISLGRFWAVLNTPQYHRIHHAVSETYMNSNFAGLFPVFDVMFGTCYRPRRGEYPAVGLQGGDAPAGLLEAVLWPVRRGWRVFAHRLPGRSKAV